MRASRGRAPIARVTSNAREQAARDLPGPANLAPIRRSLVPNQENPLASRLL
jgi:hypothetical protein